MAIATAMYHSEKNPLKKVGRHSERVETVRSSRQRRLHKAFLRYHDPENWPLLREALKEMGRSDLIGNGKKHLIPIFQPPGTGLRHKSHSSDVRTAGRAAAGQPAVRPSARSAGGKKPPAIVLSVRTPVKALKKATQKAAKQR